MVGTFSLNDHERLEVFTMNISDGSPSPSIDVQEQNKKTAGADNARWQYVLSFLQGIPEGYIEAKHHLDSVYRIFSEKELHSREQLKQMIDAISMASLETQHTGTDRKNSKAAAGAVRQVNSLRAHCLGNFELVLNWKKCDRWQSLKAKSLIKYLVSHKNRPVPREALIEMLWPECDPESGNNNLKSTVYALRQMFSKLDPSATQNTPVVLYSDGAYHIDPSIQLWVDSEEFESYWLAGRRLEKNKQVGEAIKYYQFAEELYGGDYLEDEMYTEWTLLKREALKDTYLAILTKLISFSFDEQDYENCIVYCQKILSKDPCHEEAYSWLMRCYDRLGQSRRAQQWFDIYENTIRKELDASPSQKMRALQKQILNRESS
jgi:DNA-binding SARP family transcriptional activator